MENVRQKGRTFDAAYAMLRAHDWSDFSESACHGDLTLENIIVKSDQLYVIDFLDSFFDSWLIDIGTLLQDVQMLWSYRYTDELDINALIRLMVFRDVLMDELDSIDSEISKEAYYALLLKLMRIVPYSKDERTMDFLTSRIDELMNILGGM